AVHGQLQHEPAAAHRQRPTDGGDPQSQRGDRPGTDAAADVLPASGVHARIGRRAGTQGRDPGPPSHLVRRCVLGLGFPRGRHPQCGRGGRRARRALAGGATVRGGDRCRWRRDRGPGVNGPVATTALASAVYEGRVRHRRHAPRPHVFDYSIAQLYLALDELDAVFASHRLWSVDRRNVAEFRRSDYLGPPERGLADAVRDRVHAATGTWPEGPVRLLTHLRYFGY